MAWIPLLLAGWIVVDVLIVATVLVLARRRRQRELRAVPPTPLVPVRERTGAFRRAVRSAGATPLR
jgi:hypothetical protein